MLLLFLRQNCIDLEVADSISHACRKKLELVPRYPLQKPPSRGLEGSGGEGERGRRFEDRRGLHLQKASRGLEGLQGGLKGASP